MLPVSRQPGLELLRTGQGRGAGNRTGNQQNGARPHDPRTPRRTRLSIHHIAERLNAQGIEVGVSTVASVLRRAGRPRLRRPPVHVLGDLVRPDTAETADAVKLDLEPRRFRTMFGGLFLPLLETVGLDGPTHRHGMPGSGMIPAACAFRSLLALKLWGIGRPSHAMPEVFDDGLALFAGLEAFPKRATLTEYSCRIDPRTLPGLMRDWADDA